MVPVKTILATLAVAAATAAMVACGGDDSGSGPPPALDAGNDATARNPDGGSPRADAAAEGGSADGALTDGALIDGSPADGSTSDASNDAADAGPCDFNQFVMGLIQNHTNSVDRPSADLGQACVDSQKPFPTALFQ